MATTTNNSWPTPNDSDAFKLGASAMRDLGNAIDTSTGNGLLTWTPYTPTLSGMSLGNGTVTFRYAKIGKIVHIRGVVTFGTTSTMTGPVDISLPVSLSAVGYAFGQSFGNANYYSSLFYGTNVFVGNIAYLRPVVFNAASTYLTNSDLSATIPFTWNNGKQMFISCAYEGQ